ncbi:LPXTG cell wall anchor domain-containing protein [Streptomyces sp. NPDC057494]|uniref:LPXTG cell wall anchor domain-containing protein n=1 Tax=Streptomyces sp. NPDC057494 TaxID=3346148 RepID=UPI003690691F
MRRSLIPAAALVAAMAGSVILAPTAFASQGPKGDNGTVKIHDSKTGEEVKANEPKVCEFYLDAFHFDATQKATWSIEAWANNDQDKGTEVEHGDITLDAEGHGRTEDMTLADGQYKLFWNFDGEHGKAKHKVFKVECEEEGTGGTTGETTTGGTTGETTTGGPTTGETTTGGTTTGETTTGGTTTGETTTGGSTTGETTTGGSTTGETTTGGTASTGGSSTGETASTGGSASGETSTGGSTAGGSATGGETTGGSAAGGTDTKGEGNLAETGSSAPVGLLAAAALALAAAGAVLVTRRRKAAQN